MNDIKQYEPLWGSWYIDEQLGEGSFGKVYKVHKEEFGKLYYAAVKMISIPQSQAEVEQARSEGIDDASMHTYFRAFVTDIVQEIDFMSAFKGNTNIVSLEDHEVVQRKDAIGWDILIRMELLTSLSSFMNNRPLAPEDVMQVGIDISRALELCAVRNTIHRDIKPDNIFVSQYGDYKLGDFGVARQIERTMSGLSKKGTYTYMAPEVFAGKEYGPSVDLYSLGIVMYRYLNNNRTPFLPPFPEPITPNSREEAQRRRMTGEALPDIPDIDPKLNALILKACAYNPEDRFKDATEFRTTLEKIAGTTPKPPAKENKREPIKAGIRKPRAMRENDDDGKTMGVFVLRHNEQEEEEIVARPEVPQKIVNIFAIAGAVLSGILTLFCLFSGARGDIFISMPLYALCVALCVINFKHPALNATLIIWLICYLTSSALIFNIFNYPLLTLTIGILSVEAMRSSSNKYRIALSVTLIACAVVSGVLIGRALGGSALATFRAYTTASFSIPLILFIGAIIVMLPKREDGKIIASLTALQLYSLIAFFMYVFGFFGGGNNGANILFNVIDASFIGFSPERFSWWRYGRVLGLIIQALQAICMIYIAAAKMIPEDFLGLMANKKKAVPVGLIFVVVITVGIYLLTLMF